LKNSLPIIIASAVVVSTCVILAIMPPHRVFARDLDFSRFSKQVSSCLLCIDVSDESGDPLGGLRIRLTNMQKSEWRSSFLMFPIADVRLSRKMCLSNATYNDLSVLHYMASSGTRGDYEISFRPFVNNFPDWPFDVSKLKPGIYFQRSDPSERYLIISTSDCNKALDSDLLTGPIDLPQGIAVALPIGATGKEIENGLTMIPPATATDGQVNYFEPKAAGQTVSVVKLRYTLKPSDPQKFILIIVGKAFVALFVIALALYGLKREEIRRAKFRLILLWGIGLVEAIALIGIALLARSLGLDSARDTIADVAICLFGGVFTILMLRVQHPITRSGTG
jgi:hypothetical protein